MITQKIKKLIFGDLEGKMYYYRRLPSGKVANGNWNPNPNYRKVKFNWNSSDNCNPGNGARLEISRKELR